MIKQAKNCGEPLPARIRNKPQLRVGLLFFLYAFYALDTERNAADLERIPWSALRSYADASDCDEIECEQLEFFVRCIDDMHLKRIAAKQKV